MSGVTTNHLSLKIFQVHQHFVGIGTVLRHPVDKVASIKSNQMCDVDVTKHAFYSFKSDRPVVFNYNCAFLCPIQLSDEQNFNNIDFHIF